MSIWIQITSGRGPAECCKVVTHIASLLRLEAEAAGAAIQLLEEVPGDHDDTHHSIVFTISADQVPPWLQGWLGTIQWIGTSTYRPHHRRKNWFVGVQVIHQPPAEQWNRADVRIDTFRASGPGGQHVNKTESAVRATHTPSGVYVVAQEGRSQHENKALALERLKRKLQAREETTQSALRKQLRDQHDELERGNPVRVYSGESFTRVR